MSVLHKIIEAKKSRVAHSKTLIGIGDIKKRAYDTEPARPFRPSIKRGPEEGIKLIAELKKASPSRGMIRPEFDAASIARIFTGRANAVSVLTEEDFFAGSLDFIKVVKDNSPMPVLRKDFIIEEYQVYESRAAGADAVLLIDAALDTARARELMQLSNELGMAVLYEVHSEPELQNALEIKADIIGVNSRDLKTLDINTGMALEILRAIPMGIIKVSESGIEGRDAAVSFMQAGADAMLIGTAIMKAHDIGIKMDELLGRRS